jgi:lysophospholipase L1-like esterase
VGPLRHWGQQAVGRAVIRTLAVAALATGCGGPDGPSATETEARGRATIVAALGDSITAGTPLWDPNPGFRSQIPEPDERSQYEYWAERALPGTRFRNCGINGQRTDQIALRLDRCAAGADVLIVQGGVNDIAQGLPVEDAAKNLRFIVRQGQELGLRAAVVELLPWNGGFPAADPSIRELNRRIAAIGRQENVPVIEWYELLENPRQPGRMRLRWTIDLAHPSIEGYRRLGEAVELPGP